MHGGNGHCLTALLCQLRLCANFIIFVLDDKLKTHQTHYQHLVLFAASGNVLLLLQWQ